ncbi:hypothetical protein J113_15185 [Mycobacterium tuberculosis CAS/NITR204]|uniref:Uncharacterized protein n=1 Tax=Mycobacterium tuberculosis CAS/NITR204 TaxID=1310114 RepID=R4MFC4_MYCTX|nr:hypothetical protein J113_15185 [Mycobacterium tuberculosis CAS/NITR204]
MAVRAGQHPASSATRSGASRASGAAAPNQTVSMSCSAISRRIRTSTVGPGSITVLGWRTTR